MDVLDMQERTLEQTLPLVEGVRPDQYAAPTPCTKWTVRDLISHIVGGNLAFAAIGEGKSLREARPGGDVLGDDPVAAYRRSAEKLRTVWREPGRLDGQYELPIGTMPGPAAVTLRMTDTLAHGWDLARATGQTTRYDDDIVEAALRFSQANLGRERPPGAPFADAVDCPEDAPPLDRLAAFLGRRP